MGEKSRCRMRVAFILALVIIRLDYPQRQFATAARDATKQRVYKTLHCNSVPNINITIHKCILLTVRHIYSIKFRVGIAKLLYSILSQI